jgi:serine/threonine protein kinase
MNIQKVQYLGSGSYGTVYKVIDKNNNDRSLVLKQMNVNKNGEIHSDIIKEIINTQNLVHPNIIATEPVIDNDGKPKVYYYDISKKNIEFFIEVMNGDVESLGKEQLTTDILRKLVYDVTNGLYHMHSMGYIHNDIKPQNILYKLEDGKYTFKIGDFGISQYMGIPFPQDVFDFASTRIVKAPNSINDFSYVKGNRYNYNSDMFSLGATMFWLCTIRYDISFIDFVGKDNRVFIDINKKGFSSQASKIKEMYGKNGYDFLIKCMEPKSSKRMSSKKALEHPYLRPMRGGAIKPLLEVLNKTYKETTLDDFKHNIYELEYLDDMYNLYKDTTVSLFIESTLTTPTNQGHYINMVRWTYGGYFALQTLETFLQFQLNYIQVININKLDLSAPKKYLLWLVSTLNICHNILSTFLKTTINLDFIIKYTYNYYNKEEITETEVKILDDFNGKITVKPVMFFLNYWYLKSIYTGKNKKPNINVLNTSLAVMLAIMLSNSIPELQNIKLDDLAKYCVHKALTLRKYTNGVNVAILTDSTSLDWNLLDTCVSEFCIKSLEVKEYEPTELLTEMRALLKE